VKIPDGVDFESAAFVTLGAIALQGVRRANLTLGESVAVIGLGLLGQLTVQLVKATGCKMMGIDLDAEKVKLAKEMRADTALVRSENVVQAAMDFSKGYGVDAIIITAATEEQGVDYPIGYVRWTEQRNMQEFLNLVAQKKVIVDKLEFYWSILKNAQ